MEKLIIRGGNKLAGNVPISGAKNAALPLMCAALLSPHPLTLHNVPRLADINTLSALLNHHGISVTMQAAGGRPYGHSLLLSCPEIQDTTAPYDMVRKMRASILVLGPLVARTGTGRVSLPGGCAIGTRPIDLHLKGLKALGAEIILEAGYVEARAKKGLKGGRVVFPVVSVGATENVMMAATLAHGETILENAAREPEIVDLAQCLNAMGAKIRGAGTSHIEIEGVDSLKPATHTVVADRIEAGSYAIAAAITGGNLLLEGATYEIMDATVAALRETGSEVHKEEKGLRVIGNGRPAPLDLTTQPFPGFPTDMQAQFMALLALSSGASVIHETIFENRYMHAPELSRMGADIHISGASATIRGVDRLIGAPVMATDLRASMGLALAGLAANGETEVNRLYHLDRGYERLEQKLKAAGADVERVSLGS